MNDSLPDPEKLLEIADHIDALRNVLLPTWRAATNDPRAAQVVYQLEDQRMQNDLRSWADSIAKRIAT